LSAAPALTPLAPDAFMSIPPGSDHEPISKEPARDPGKKRGRVVAHSAIAGRE
jgi:hypothetical protein